MIRFGERKRELQYTYTVQATTNMEAIIIFSPSRATLP